MAGPGTAARPPRGGLVATRPAEPENAEDAAAPSNAGGDLAIFTDPEFGEPWRWWCDPSRGVMFVLLAEVAEKASVNAADRQPMIRHLMKSRCMMAGPAAVNSN